jgi:hypothetical protein
LILFDFLIHRMSFSDNIIVEFEFSYEEIY